MGLNVALLFHANMPFTYAFEIAHRSTYAPLPKIMRNFPELPFNWHLSIPLIQQLQWQYPETLKIYHEGFKDNQFEFLGSSYAQNVLYSCSSWANRLHLDENHRILKNIFKGLKLKGFWNPERVWFDDLDELISECGYNYTLIEKKILKRALAQSNINLGENSSLDHLWIKSVKSTGQPLYIFPDNQEFLQKVNAAIWHGKIDELFRYFDQRMESDSTDLVLCYAEDAEASGTWQALRGENSKKIHQNLTRLFQAFMNHSWVNVKLFSDIISDLGTHKNMLKIDKIPSGQATWMIDSVKVDGYKDWFDYADNSPEINYYKQHYAKFEKRFQNLPENLKLSNIAQEILTKYLQSQFEFGCAPGSFGDLSTRYLMNIPGYCHWDWLDLLNNLLDWVVWNSQTHNQSSSNSPSNQIFQSLQWVNRGFHPVIEWLSHKWSSQWSTYGGRCILLVDFSQDTIISPNIYSMGQNEPRTETIFPSKTILFDFEKKKNSLFTHGDIFMDHCIIDGKPLGQSRPTRRHIKRNSQEFSDEKRLSHTKFKAIIKPHDPSILFWYFERGILFKKEIRMEQNDISCHYSMKNTSKKKRKYHLEIINTFAPNPRDIIDNGKTSLKMNQSDEHLKNCKNYSISIQNIIGHSKITISCFEKPKNFDYILELFGIRTRWRFQGEILPNSSKEIQFTIQH
jgi:hypothetical protein